MKPIQQIAATFALAILLAACSSVPAAVTEGSESAASPATLTEVASVEGITEYRLDNGLRVLLFPDQSKQQITVNVTYLVGSRHEGYGETGMAHLLEHLVFKGTPKHPNIAAELTEHGAFANGTTWFDRTNYYETLPATDENLVWALDLEADRMVNSFIAAEDLESEMTVVRNEMESGENNPYRILSQRLMSAAYTWHNYGNSTIGARADVESVPIERLQAFYRKYYQPDNAILVLAGRFDVARALEVIGETFGAIPRPDRSGANTLFATYTAEPPQDGERTVTLRRVGDTQLVMAGYHIPAGSAAEYPAVDVLTHILATEPAGRLYKKLVEPGLAANASAGSYQLKEPGMMFARAEVRQEDSLAEATDAMLAALDEIVAEPPTEEEVNRAKTDYLSGMELAFNNPQGIALQLSEWAAMGDWRLMFLHRDRLEEVTPEAVHAAANAYLKPSNRTIAYFYPTDETPPRAEIPPPPDVDALVADYKGREAVAAGEAFDPSPANIEARTQKITLANGMKVALLPKENRGDAVTLSVSLSHGDEQTLTGKATAAVLAGQMLMRGTVNRSRQEIRDEFDRLKVQGGAGGGLTGASGNIVTVRENLPAALRLVAEVLREPAFDEAEFATLREERLAAFESVKSEPGNLANQALARHLNAAYPPGHPLYVSTFEELIANYEAATVADAKAFWEAFYGADGDDRVAVVGDFDPAEIVPILEEAFGDWAPQNKHVRVADPYREIETEAVDIETPDKANAVMYAALPFAMRDDHPDYPALALANYMMGGGFLNSRLAVRIRQQEGLSYGVGSNLVVPALDNAAAFMAYAIFAPENGDKVVQAFQEELNRAVVDGFTADEVDAAKRGYLDSAKNGRTSDSRVAGTLASNLYLDRTMAFVEDQEAAIAALTAETVNAAVQRHLDPAKVSVFRGGDFANKLAKAE